MRLGYNTNGFASHRLLDAIEIVAEIGYQSVAITLDHHALDPYADWRQQAAEVARRLRDLDLQPVIETGARFLLDPRRKHRPTLMDAAPADRDRRIDFLARAAEIGEALGASVLSLWSGARESDCSESVEALDARLAAGLARVCQAAADCGQVVAFEPEPGMYIESMRDFERIRQKVDAKNFHLTLDLGHALITEGEVEPSIRRWVAEIRNVHVEGMRRGVHDHLVPWEGDLDVRGALAALRDTGYQGPATLELSRHSHAAVEVARRAYDFLSASS